jgi:hypothetical protein
MATVVFNSTVPTPISGAPVMGDITCSIDLVDRFHPLGPVEVTIESVLIPETRPHIFSCHRGAALTLRDIRKDLDDGTRERLADEALAEWEMALEWEAAGGEPVEWETILGRKTAS